MRRLLPLVLLALALILAPAALGKGGNYSFDGGTGYEQSQVKQALAISAFDWSLVPGPVVIHIQRGIPSSDATPGNIWLDADLLDAGEFSWGVVQHEYGHQVDFALLNDTVRAQLLPELGGLDWWDYAGQYRHDQRGCERFASTLAWSYWPSPENSMRPSAVGDESSALPPQAFRALLRQTLMTLSVQGAEQLPLTLAAVKPVAKAKVKPKRQHVRR